MLDGDLERADGEVAHLDRTARGFVTLGWIGVAGGARRGAARGVVARFLDAVAGSHHRLVVVIVAAGRKPEQGEGEEAAGRESQEEAHGIRPSCSGWAGA